MSSGSIATNGAYMNKQISAMRARMDIGWCACLLLLLLLPATTAFAQRTPAWTLTPRKPVPTEPREANASSVVTPSGYVIAADDVLGVMFWREKDLSVDVQVRPDGKITLPLLNDMQAAGLTPDQLREQITAAANKYVEDPSVTVLVRAMNSRRVFITGNVNKPGQYPLAGPTTVVQLIAMAGGLQEYADKSKIVVMRTENGQQVAQKFNFKDVLDRKNLKQNVELRPGDTVIVP
jgi:polysaccharide biosynthesis/export protein